MVAIGANWILENTQKELIFGTKYSDVIYGRISTTVSLIQVSLLIEPKDLFLLG